MAISEEYAEKLDTMLSALEADTGALNEWEQGFIADQRKRLTQYGKEIFLSPKQQAKIKAIYDAVIGDSEADDEGLGIDDEIPF